MGCRAVTKQHSGTKEITVAPEGERTSDRSGNAVIHEEMAASVYTAGQMCGTFSQTLWKVSLVKVFTQ